MEILTWCLIAICAGLAILELGGAKMFISDGSEVRRTSMVLVYWMARFSAIGVVVALAMHGNQLHIVAAYYLGITGLANLSWLPILNPDKVVPTMLVVACTFMICLLIGIPLAVFSLAVSIPWAYDMFNTSESNVQVARREYGSRVSAHIGMVAGSVASAIRLKLSGK